MICFGTQGNTLDRTFHRYYKAKTVARIQYGCIGTLVVQCLCYSVLVTFETLGTPYYVLRSVFAGPKERLRLLCGLYEVMLAFRTEAQKREPSLLQFLNDFWSICLIFCEWPPCVRGRKTLLNTVPSRQTSLISENWSFSVLRLLVDN